MCATQACLCACVCVCVGGLRRRRRRALAVGRLSLSPCSRAPPPPHGLLPPQWAAPPFPIVGPTPRRIPRTPGSRPPTFLSLCPLSLPPLTPPSLSLVSFPCPPQPKPRTKRRKADEEGASPSSSDDEGGAARRAGRPSASSNPPLPADLSAKVLREARAQQAEVEAEGRGTRGLGSGKVRERHGLV